MVAVDGDDHPRNSKDQFSIVTVLYHSSDSTSVELSGWAQVMSDLKDTVEWIVIDNSEDTADSEFFEQFRHIENIRYSRRPDNPGFAASSNQGANSSSRPWLVFLNPDVFPDREKLRRVLDQVLTSSTVPTTFAVGQITDNFRHQGICLLAGGVWFSDRPEGSKNLLLGPSGGIGIYPRMLFQEFDGFSEDLFAWGEDAELAIRLSSSGVLCLPIDEYFDHAGGHSFKGVERLRKKKVWLLARNRQTIARRHYGLEKLIRFEAMTLAVTLAKLPVHIRNKTVAAVVRGNIDGLKLSQRAERGARSIPTTIASTGEKK